MLPPGHRNFCATRPCWSKGNGGCDDSMKLRLSSSGDSRRHLGRGWLGSSELGARPGTGRCVRPPAHAVEHALRAAQWRDLQRLEVCREGALEALAGVVREDVLARGEEAPDFGIAL